MLGLGLGLGLGWYNRYVGVKVKARVKARQGSRGMSASYGTSDPITECSMYRMEMSYAVVEQECHHASSALLITGEDPESEDGRRLVQVVQALHQARTVWSPNPFGFCEPSVSVEPDSSSCCCIRRAAFSSPHLDSALNTACIC